MMQSQRYYCVIVYIQKSVFYRFHMTMDTDMNLCTEFERNTFSFLSMENLQNLIFQFMKYIQTPCVYICVQCNYSSIL